jgi:septum formation protein
MSGAAHDLYSAAVIAENGQPVWRFVDRAKLHVRVLSEDFIQSYLDAYLDRQYETIRWSVGGYRIEGEGLQLFDRVEGSHFAILGMPLLPLLAYLRERGLLER